MNADLVTLIADFARTRPDSRWDGTATQLLDELRALDHDSGCIGRVFPDHRSFGKELKDARYSLLHQGCEIRQKVGSRGRIIFLRGFKVEQPRQERPPESGGGMSIISERELLDMEEAYHARRRAAQIKFEETPQPRNALWRLLHGGRW